MMANDQKARKYPGNRIRLVGGLNRFAFRLFQQLCEEQPEGNLFLSPSSVAIALAMTHLGTNGKTEDELASLLGYSMPEEKRREAFRELAEATRTGGVEFRSANRLWAQASYHFLDDFLRATREDFGAELAAVDFENDVDAARREINAWIEEQTANRIQQAVPPGCLDAMTRLVLVNAVYFLGNWESPFEKESTNDVDFIQTDGSNVPVPTMHQSGQFSYAESDTLKVLQLPYRSYGIELRKREVHGESYEEPYPVEEEGSDFCMEILLPAAGSSVFAIAQLLASEGLAGLPSSTFREVRIYLPKYRIECPLLLGETLKALGVRDAFSVDDADFTAMSDDPEGLFLSEVAHKAFVDVNEEGTEAAAATAVFAAGGAAGPPPPPVEFKADHPFIFLIRDTATGLVHFIGRLEEPRAE